MLQLNNRIIAFFLALILLLPAAAYCQDQETAPAAKGVIGAGNYIRVVEDLDRTVEFYYDLIGVEPRGGLVPREFGVLEPVASMYNAVGGEFRSASFTIPNTSFVLEHLEWRDADRSRQQTRIQDPGTAVLLLVVTDIEASMASVVEHGGHILTPGQQPIATAGPSFILVQDPDGYFIELIQPGSPQANAEAKVVTGRFRLTVNDIERSREFYQAAFGFSYPAPEDFSDNPVLGKINGYEAGFKLISAPVPGSSLPVELLQYRDSSGPRLQQQLPRIGSSMLRIFVSDLDMVVNNALAAGAVLAANNEHPVATGNNSRFQIIEGPDGLLVQLVQRPR